MKIFYNSFIPKILQVDGVTIGKYIFVSYAKESVSEVLINHETIHYFQIKKDGILKFYCKYFKEYFSNRLKGMSHYKAYVNISYEKEAYQNQWPTQFKKIRKSYEKSLS
jgi:hypothetical protein